MKKLVTILLFSLISSANTQLKVDSMTPLHIYNHKPSVKLAQQRKLKSLARINKKEAISIAVSICKEDVTINKLTHRGQLLFYRIYAKDCKIEINALDGAIISKELL